MTNLKLKLDAMVLYHNSAYSNNNILIMYKMADKDEVLKPKYCYMIGGPTTMEAFEPALEEKFSCEV